MHELSIAISLVEAAEEEAVKRSAASVSAVYLKLGALAGVAKDALLFSYELASEGTLLAGSRLVIQDSPALVFCKVCQSPQPLKSPQAFCCAVCGEPATEVVQGRELEVVALELSE